jgi:1-acyl-sn-glycerol-3-phosphate acyltransferase
MSNADPPMVGSFCPRPIYLMAKEELFKKTWFRYILDRVGAIPIKRGEADTSSIRAALGFLSKGEVLVVFPEGMRGDGKRLLPLMPGAALLAKRTKAQVVPIGIIGTEIMNPKGGKFTRHRVTMVYGEPFTFEQYPDTELFLAELAKRISDATETAGRRIKTATELSGQTEGLAEPR